METVDRNSCMEWMHHQLLWTCVKNQPSSYLLRVCQTDLNMNVLLSRDEDLEHDVVLYQTETVLVIGWQLYFVLPVKMPDVAFKFLVEYFLNLAGYLPLLEWCFALWRENLYSWTTMEC